MIPIRRKSGSAFALWWRLALLLAALSGVVRFDRSAVFIPAWRTSSLAGIRPQVGFAYVAPTGHSELSAHQVPSLAEVWEDGHPLPGPGNASHDEIRQVGKGRYSFWHSYVYFAASDNSDPRTNGRRYEIHFPWMVGTYFAFGLYAAAFFALAAAAASALRQPGAPEVAKAAQRVGRALRYVARPPFYFCALLVIGAFAITRAPFFLHYPEVGVAPDTRSYVSVVAAIRGGHWPLFSIRTPGYPLFVWLLTHIANRWLAVILGQCLLSLAACLGLVYAVHRLRPALALPATVAMAAFLSSSQVLIYDTLALSDSLYTDCVILSVACMVLGFACAPARWFAAASAAMAAAILVRPVGMYFLVIYGIFLAYLLWNRFGARTICSFALPLPSLLLALCAYNRATLGLFVISPFGEANLAGATVLFWEPDPSLPDFVNRALVELPASYRHAGLSPADLSLIRTSWDPARLYDVFSRSYNSMSYGEGWAFGARFHHGSYVQSRNYLRQICLVAIRRHPLLYAKFVWANLAGYFQGVGYKFDFYSVLAQRAGQGIADVHATSDPSYTRDFFQGASPADFAIGLSPPAPGPMASTFLGRLHRAWEFREQQWFQSVLWMWAWLAVSAVAAVRLARSRGRHFGAFLLCLLALVVIGGSLVTCLVEETMDRYSYPTQFIYYLTVALLPLLAARSNVPNGAPSPRR